MHLQSEQLSRFKIQGYKSIKDCDIEFNKINVLIGSNGAGKSNFISAFSFLQDMLAKNCRWLLCYHNVRLLCDARQYARYQQPRAGYTKTDV